MAARGSHDQSGSRTWVRAGALFGVVAGIVFAMFEMVAAALMGQGFFMPLRMIGAIALGKEALMPTYSLATAAGAGLAVHLALSALYGAVFAGIAGSLASLRQSVAALVAAATGYGIVLWIVNFYVMAPLLFPWFQDANAVIQFLAHAFFYGTVLSVLLVARYRPEHRPGPAPVSRAT